MNKIVNKFLSTGDKFIPELHLRHPEFTYCTCRPFTNHRQRIQKFRVTGDLNYICKDKLDKNCCADDAAYSDSKDLAKRTISDKTLKEKAYEIAINHKYDGYQTGLASIVWKIFDEKTESRTTKKWEEM